MDYLKIGRAALAERLRAETAVTVKWIAERLRMGSPGYVNHLLYRRRKGRGSELPISRTDPSAGAHPEAKEN